MVVVEVFVVVVVMKAQHCGYIDTRSLPTVKFGNIVSYNRSSENAPMPSFGGVYRIHTHFREKKVKSQTSLGAKPWRHLPNIHTYPSKKIGKNIGKISSS